MGMLREFKEFAMRGNVMDLAIGIVLGTAFGLIVTSLVNDVLMPPIGMATGHIDFKDLKLVLKQAYDEPAIAANGTAPAVAAKHHDEVAIRYGIFVNQVINFLIVAFSIFVVVKILNTLKRKEATAPPPPAPPTKSEVLLAEIRDSLKSRV